MVVDWTKETIQDRLIAAQRELHDAESNWQTEMEVGATILTRAWYRRSRAKKILAAWLRLCAEIDAESRAATSEGGTTNV